MQERSMVNGEHGDYGWNLTPWSIMFSLWPPKCKEKTCGERGGTTRGEQPDEIRGR